jgi:hypothetical protein
MLDPGFHFLSFRLDPFTSIASSLTISNLQPGSLVPVLPGDFNQDGSVDTADYVVWRHTYTSSSDLRADANGNGNIGAEDYEIWRKYFGTTSAAAAASLIPESATFTMAACVLSMVGVHRWRLTV